MSESPINDVSDTAFWIAQHRAIESARADALFRDPFAARLAGERGQQIARAMPHAGVIGWSVAIRTRIIDEFIGAALDDGIDAVLNLGAGLDARPYRMDLRPRSSGWRRTIRASSSTRKAAWRESGRAAGWSARSSISRTRRRGARYSRR